MNERIKEIALECYNPYNNFDYEKFAKLIIKECATVGDKAYSDVGDFTYISNKINEHFGVK